MADKTDFAGLTRLAPDDSISDDNSSFQAVNPTIIDRYLRRAIEHRHTGATGLADPATEPAVVADPTQGFIPADASLQVTYTLVDSYGGETLAAPATTITTAAALSAPDDEPTLVLSTAGGILRPGTYDYAVALVDDAGGETPIGPSGEITRELGPANANITVSGLTAIVAATPGATGWRLYRSINSQPFYYLAAGPASTDSVVDNGSLCVDCTSTPLDDEQNTTNATNAITVTIPTDDIGDAAAIRIYVSDGPTFLTPSLLDEIGPADAGTAITYTQLDVLDGQPPDATQALPQPEQIDAQTEITNLYWRAPVTNAAALPATGNVVGDTRVALATKTIHTWDGDAWEAVSGGGGGGGGGGGLEPRTDYVLASTGSVAPAAQATGTVNIAPGYRVLRVAHADGNVRVRLYGTAAKRTADAARPAYSWPTGDHGLMLDVTLGPDQDDEWLLPAVAGFNQNTPATSSVYFTLTNLGAARALSVELTAVSEEG